MNVVTRWLESPEGETWSRDHHRPPRTGGQDVPAHIASVESAPGTFPVWDRLPSYPGSARNPEHDPSGRPPLSCRQEAEPARQDTEYEAHLAELAAEAKAEAEYQAALDHPEPEPEPELEIG